MTLPIDKPRAVALRLIWSMTWQLIALAVFVAIAIAGNTAYAQKPLERKVTLSLKNVALEKAIAKIEEITGVKFVYSPSRFQMEEIVSVEAVNKNLDDVLKELLTPHGIGYTLKENSNQVLLSPLTESSAKEERNYQERIQITGTVTDADHRAMPGVNVVVKGTINGTSTGADGTYTLKANDSDVLVFSFIGYRPIEVNVAAHSVINVSLEEDATSLKEIVINAGYYDVTDKEKTGSIAKVTSDIIEKQPVTNPLGALQGRMPGVFISQTTGIPGGGFNIQIRGRNSLRTEGNDPLYIVDGVPFSSERVSSSNNTSGIFYPGTDPLTSLNPSDIESIEILKDADATAIYGSRGANGVVLITTKKGKEGKTKFDLNVYAGAGKAPQVKLLNTQQYLAMRREALANDGLIPSANPTDAGYAVDLMVWDTTRYTDWQKVLIGNTAQTYSLQSSLSGGSSHTQFLFSIGYRRENSALPGSLGYQKGSSHLSVNHRSSNNKFFFNVSISGSLDKNDQINEDLTTTSRFLSPNAPELYNEDGGLNWENSTWENPLAKLLQTYEGRINNLIANTVIGFEVLPGLKLKSSFGINRVHSNEVNIYPSTTKNPLLGYTSAVSNVIYSTGSNQSWIVEPQATWEKSINRGQLSALVGGTFQEQAIERSSIIYSNFPSNSLLHDLLSAATTRQSQYVLSLYRYTAFFGRVNFNWDTKYILNLTARRDGSSRFGPGRQFANFGAIGLAWIFSNERFLEINHSVFSFGKLRVSYGSTGSDQIGNYQFLDTYSTNATDIYQGVTALGPTRLFNPDFAWETNLKLEGAMELGFARDRILLNLSYYRNRSSNQLVNYTLPMTTGFRGILANLPATVQNTGVETELTTKNLIGIFGWSTSFNITIPRNKLIEFPNIESSTYANRYIVGQPVYIQKFYEHMGVNPETGLHTFKDQNSDGVLTIADDKTKPVFVGQHFYGGVNNSFKYKGFTLDLFFQFVKQAGVAYLVTTVGAMINQPEFMLQKTRWRQPGDQGDWQRLATETNSAASNALLRYRSSDASIVDASFIRLKNISLSYQLPISNARSVNCRVFMQAQNLFVLTNYEGYDPESQQTRIGPLKMVTAGFQLTL